MTIAGFSHFSQTFCIIFTENEWKVRKWECTRI